MFSSHSFWTSSSSDVPAGRDRTHVPTCQKVTRLPLSYQGGRDNDGKLTYRSSVTRYIRHLPVVLVVFVFHTISSYICDSMSKR